jgi:hypothetical protein
VHALGSGTEGQRRKKMRRRMKMMRKRKTMRKRKMTTSNGTCCRTMPRTRPGYS